MNASNTIKKISKEMELIRIGSDRLSEWAFATNNMFRKTLGIKYTLSPDFLDRLLESSHIYQDRILLLAVTKNGLIRGTGSIINVKTRGESHYQPIFADYGFNPGDLGDTDPHTVYLLTRLVLDLQGLTVEERWLGLRIMKLTAFQHCFADKSNIVVGLPDAPRMTKFYARQGIFWRLLSQPKEFPAISGYKTSKCILAIDDLSDNLRAELELQPERYAETI